MKYTLMKYLRISSEDIDLDGLDKYESNSISHQRALLDDFISKMPEFENSEILEAVDDGRTGTNFNRPGVQNLLDLAQRGKIHCIIVKDLSRFGRNYLEVGDYLEQIFPVWGIRFISINDMYDSAKHNGATGGIDIAFRNLIAEMYSQDLSEKVKSARTTISKGGKTCASYSFFGYCKDPDNHHKLIIDEPAAEIVRLIFNLREQGMTSPKIASKLNRDGVPTANERKKEKGAKRDWQRNGKVNMWESGFITRILNDERYTGKHIYGKTKRVEIGKMATKAVPQSEWIVVPDAFPAIITDEQFARVRDIISKNTKASTKSNKPFGEKLPFYRKLFCGTCGRALSRSSLGSGKLYRCVTKSNISGLDCMCGSIHESVITETVLTVLRQQAQFADSVKIHNSTNLKSSSLTIEDLRGELQNLQRCIEKSKSTKMSLWEDYNAGSISKEVFQSESEKLTVLVEEYADAITELETKIRKLEMESGQENIFVERFSKQVDIQELSRIVVDEFIQAIHVYAPDRIEVTLNYMDEYAKIVRLMGGSS